MKICTFVVEINKIFWVGIKIRGRVGIPETHYFFWPHHGMTREKEFYSIIRNGGQIYIPKARYSDSSLVKQFRSPTVEWSDRSLFRQLISLTVQYSDIPIVRRLNSPAIFQKFEKSKLFNLI